MDPDADGALGSHPFGEADVVGVAVCQDDRPDVLESPAHRGKLGREVAPHPADAGVDHGDATSLLDEVDVHDARPESVDSVRDPHRGRWAASDPT